MSHTLSNLRLLPTEEIDNLVVSVVMGWSDNPNNGYYVESLTQRSAAIRSNGACRTCWRSHAAASIRWAVGSEPTYCTIFRPSTDFAAMGDVIARMRDLQWRFSCDGVPAGFAAGFDWMGVSINAKRRRIGESFCCQVEDPSLPMAVALSAILAVDLLTHGAKDVAQAKEVGSE